MLGRWRGSVSAPNRHEMDSKFENDKLKSLKCSCKEQTCEEHYTYGTGISAGCAKPECNVISYEICDSWKKKVKNSIKYKYILFILNLILMNFYSNINQILIK